MNAQNQQSVIMELSLTRIATNDRYTIGRLKINGKYFCDILEPADRGLSSDMPLNKIKCIKVHGKTAIPTGRYRIDMKTVSPRFKNRTWAKPFGGILPRLLDVPFYTGVRIHVGNDENNTEGCLLTGYNSVKGKVASSAKTFTLLMSDYLLPADKRGEEIWIEVTRAY
mgnify:CR=1 FL=1